MVVKREKRVGAHERSVWIVMVKFLMMLTTLSSVDIS